MIKKTTQLCLSIGRQAKYAKVGGLLHVYLALLLKRADLTRILPYGFLSHLSQNHQVDIHKFVVSSLQQASSGLLNQHLPRIRKLKHLCRCQLQIQQ